jgi:hypothetical protein
MKRLPFAAVAVAVLTLASGAEGHVEKIPVSGEIVGVAPIDAGKLTFKPNGIVILQDAIADEDLTGDLAGTMRVKSSAIVNINTGQGILFGTIDWKDPNSEGGFRGPFAGAMSGAFAPGLGEFDGQWWLRGYGTRRNETALIDNFGPFSLPQVYKGVIRIPHGH